MSMTQEEKVKQLSSMVEAQLLPLIDHDYVLYGLPYLNNIGDTLIWEGTLEFLKKVPYNCKGVCGYREYPTEDAAKDNIVLIRGGGYFGDLWSSWQCVLEGIHRYKNNKVIILPMSICYNDESKREDDVDFFAEFKDLTICARDENSFEYAKKYFKNKVLLVPDMAFCIRQGSLDRWRVAPSDKVLLLKRCDKELVSDDIEIPEINVDVHDWPTMELKTVVEARFEKSVKKLVKAQRKWPRMKSIFKKIEDGMYYWFYRKQMLSRGVSFVSSYSRIYTTRLHGLILSILLGKEVYAIDNSYGKVSGCYDTWLKDVEGVSMFIK